ncbi:helix-turn-helix transcriptional regulator [Actinosynnema sp. NPDC050436]|uniref:ArsR/SmtB family transcription factor n=1 Tax=Actinosynnema sp. NPDC050436 TaxID=3155659 RepID=UPI0033EAAD5F
MSGPGDRGEIVQSAITGLARELSDPVRLTTLQILATEGPHTMVQLADMLRVPAPRLGNHLARLRAAGLVTVEHVGRHALYRIGASDVVDVLTALARYAGSNALLPPDRAEPNGAVARTCYDHAAGRLGVRIFAMLVDRGALQPPDGSGPDLALGDDLSAYHDLGVDPTAIDPGRRRFALACLDRAQRLPHVGGSLGQQILHALLARDWVRRGSGPRDLVVTPDGRQHLSRLLPAFLD